MLFIILIAVLAALFFAVSFFARNCAVQERMKKVTKPLSVILNLSPLIGLIIFSILFAFVLKGRLAERATHALLVFALWVYATKFYVYILSYFKNKLVVTCSALGMVYSVALAIVLTPLDRYVSLIYSDLKLYSLILGCALFAVFYCVTFIFYRHLTNKP